MEITLNDIQRIMNLPSLLAVKQELLTLKKKGHIFLKENLSSLQADEPFQLYWYLMAHRSSSKNAFPIPRNRFLGNLYDEEMWQDMMSYFNDYFLSSTKNEAEWGEFAWDYPHIGEEYVWITRKNTVSEVSK